MLSNTYIASAGSNEKQFIYSVNLHMQVSSETIGDRFNSELLVSDKEKAIGKNCRLVKMIILILKFDDRERRSRLAENHGLVGNLHNPDKLIYSSSSHNNGNLGSPLKFKDPSYSLSLDENKAYNLPTFNSPEFAEPPVMVDPTSVLASL